VREVTHRTGVRSTPAGEICVFVERVDAAAHEAALKAWLDGVYAPQRVP
jgi:hypothetical protein